MAFHMDTLQGMAGQYLQSAPVPVRMAGFESNTLKMMKAGWQMSIEMQRHMYIDGVDVRCAFKHDGIKQVAMGRIRMDAESFSRGPTQMAMMTAFGQMVFAWGIDIEYIAPNIRCTKMMLPGERPTAKSFGDWSAVDLNPQMAEMDLTDFALFKPIKASDDFELYIHEKDEKEILDIILKKQDSRQKEIKQNMKRRAYQEEQSDVLKGNVKDTLNSDIKHQLILVS